MFLGQFRLIDVLWARSQGFRAPNPAVVSSGPTGKLRRAAVIAALNQRWHHLTAFLIPHNRGRFDPHSVGQNRGCGCHRQTAQSRRAGGERARADYVRGVMGLRRFRKTGRVLPGGMASRSVAAPTTGTPRSRCRSAHATQAPVQAVSQEHSSRVTSYRDLRCGISPLSLRRPVELKK